MTEQISPRDFGRMEGKLDNVKDLLEALSKTLATHEARIASLEKTDIRRLGFVAGVSAACSAVVTVISKMGLSF